MMNVYLDHNATTPVHPEVLEKLGVDSKNYTGWAFGFGLERLAIIGM